ncbi:metallophosphoesterase [Siminovitchia sp. FSL H7-0308]|nr:metallophosphoesterase [Siminovitchia thermophila]ONK24775.1 phosphoesterase [Bacillus sp. VT-16-64]
MSKKRKLIRIILLFCFISLFLYFNNHWLQTSSYEIYSERVPKPFDGLTIVQLSDLHDATFGDKQNRLVEKVKNLHPDVIFITGDIVDSNRYDLENSLDLVRQLVTLSDVYYVTGNHEVAVNQVEEINASLKKLGVHVLTNDAKTFTIDGEQLVIAGIEDPLMKGLDYPDKAVTDSLEEAFTGIRGQPYSILLSHRPEVFDVYVKKEIDLAFTGHAHGGQIRLPFIGGLIAPGQGWFPKYTAGKYERGMTTMVVNRGLGNSIIPFRIFNRPELVVVKLKSR